MSYACPNCGAPSIADMVGPIERQVENLAAERDHLGRVAHWFATCEPGTPVPEWCALDWSGGEPVIQPEHIVQSKAEWLRPGTVHPDCCDCEYCERESSE